MLIKVCGMRDASNIEAVSALGVDMIGMIFCPGSPRYVSMIRMSSGTVPDMTEERMRAISEHRQHLLSANMPRRVGVFVDATPQDIITRVYNYNLDAVQLHGSETPVMIENLRNTIVPDVRSELMIIKTVSITDADDIDKCRQYEGVADMLLFDTKCDMAGGSGRKFNWSVLDAYHGTTPFMLSGGIGPDDADAVKAFHHERLAGIDLNSRFEVKPGMKDVDKLRNFIEQIKQ